MNGFSPGSWLLALTLLLSIGLSAQDINATVKVNTTRIQNVDPKVFETLEGTIRDFLNGQKWTEDNFELEERIECNVTITIQKENSQTNFEADLAIQSSRPIYGSEQLTPIFNHLDKITFNYEQFQPLQFSRNRFIDNLSSVLSFYVYIILGFDYDSFSPNGGEPYFQIAQDIINSIPPGARAQFEGWDASGSSNRNRFWLMENMLSPRMRPLRRALYAYHREGLDLMAGDVAAGRAGVAQAVSDVQVADQAYPNSMAVQLFVNAKGQELVEIFKGGTQAEQAEVIRVMTQIDPSNAQRYRRIR